MPIFQTKTFKLGIRLHVKCELSCGVYQVIEEQVPDWQLRNKVLA